MTHLIRHQEWELLGFLLKCCSRILSKERQKAEVEASLKRQKAEVEGLEEPN